MAGQQNQLPLRTVRLVSLGLAVAFGCIGFGVGANALAKTMQEKHKVEHSAPQGVVVHININDVVSSGIVLAATCILLAFISFLVLLSQFFLHPHTHHHSSPRSFTHRVSSPSRQNLKIQSYLLGFTTTWLFATLVAFDVIARNRSAKTSATIGNLTVPTSFLENEERALGISPRYWDKGFTKQLAIIPWFTFLFGTIATVVLYMTAQRVREGSNDVAAPSSPTSTAEDALRKSNENEKAAVEHA